MIDAPVSSPPSPALPEEPKQKSTPRTTTPKAQGCIGSPLNPVTADQGFSSFLNPSVSRPNYDFNGMLRGKATDPLRPFISASATSAPAAAVPANATATKLSQSQLYCRSKTAEKCGVDPQEISAICPSYRHDDFRHHKGCMFHEESPEKESGEERHRELAKLDCKPIPLSAPPPPSSNNISRFKSWQCDTCSLVNGEHKKNCSWLADKIAKKQELWFECRVLIGHKEGCKLTQGKHQIRKPWKLLEHYFTGAEAQPGVSRKVAVRKTPRTKRGEILLRSRNVIGEDNSKGATKTAASQPVQGQHRWTKRVRRKNKNKKKTSKSQAATKTLEATGTLQREPAVGSHGGGMEREVVRIKVEDADLHEDWEGCIE